MAAPRYDVVKPRHTHMKNVPPLIPLWRCNDPWRDPSPSYHPSPSTFPFPSHYSMRTKWQFDIVICDNDDDDDYEDTSIVPPEWGTVGRGLRKEEGDASVISHPSPDLDVVNLLRGRRCGGKRMAGGAVGQLALPTLWGLGRSSTERRNDIGFW